MNSVLHYVFSIKNLEKTAHLIYNVALIIALTQVNAIEKGIIFSQKYINGLKREISNTIIIILTTAIIRTMTIAITTTTRALNRHELRFLS